MPSKFKKAIGVVKDHTSIRLAKVSNTSASANLEVTVLKATSHDAVPVEEKYVHEILSLISSSKSNAAICAQAIGKRIGKTRNWIVALKSLMLVLRIFQDGDPFFPIEVLNAMKHGARILNLSNFRDDSSGPWDYTAFVRNVALYLEERLDCILTGKLQRRFSYQQRGQESIIINSSRRRANNEPVVQDMKPATLLNQIQFWQKLLDRAMNTIPSGATKSNRLILLSLYAIVQETYDLYRDISDGMALLLDSFFHLQYQSCLSAFHACVKASKQFEELSNFYATCKGLGVGRTSEYPSVQKISEELLQTLQEFVKDQASYPGRSPSLHLNERVKDKGSVSSPEQFEFANSEPYEGTISERGSNFGSACTSLSDLLSADNGGSPSWSAEQDFYNSEEQFSEKSSSPFHSPVQEFMVGSNDKISSQSSQQIDLLDVFPPQQTDQILQANQEGENTGWELVLLESTKQSGAMKTSPMASSPPNLFASPSPSQSPNLFFESPNQSGTMETSPITSPPPNFFASPSDNNLSPSLLESSTSPDLDYFFQNSFTSNVVLHHNNPFLQDNVQVEGFAIPISNDTSSNVGLDSLDDLFSFPSTSQPSVPPTFSVWNSNGRTETETHDPKLRTTPPPLYSQNSNEMTVTPTFGAADTIDTTFHATNPEEGSSTSTSFDQNTYNSITAPTFQAEFPKDRTLALPFCAENLRETEIAPSFSAQSPERSSVSPFHESMAVPTFSARSSDNDTARMFDSPFALENEDPFGTFSSTCHTSEGMSNGTMDQEAVLNQQRQWLEQQNKIIAKYLT